MNEINLKKLKGGGGYQIQRMLPRHFQMLKLRLAGLKNCQIANILGCSPETVGIVARSPLFIAEYNRRLKDQNDSAIGEEAQAFASKARIILEENAEKAANTQVDLMDSEDDSIRLRSSGSILDRALGKTDGPGASGGPSVQVIINTKDAQLLILALKESSNGQDQDSAADSTLPEHSVDGEGDVHQASE